MYLWHKPFWDGLVENLGRLHHALLLCGPPDCGKAAFAEDLARALLCKQPRPGGEACGECPACRWMAAGNHPDFRRVVPETVSAPGEGEAAGEAPDGAGPGRRSRSSQIRIEQIRALGEFTSVGTHQSGRRVVLIRPAERMNPHTANSLLKILEEPPSSTYFLLVTSFPHRLLPTLRSRCLKVGLRKPDAAAAAVWLRQQGVGEAETALSAAGGMPLEAVRWLDSGYRSLFDWFVGHAQDGSAIDAVGAAAAWEARAGTKSGGSDDPTLATLVVWLQRWLFDLVSCRMGGEPVYFVAARERLFAIAKGCVLSALLGCYNQSLELRRACEHPLNSRLFIEDMLSRYARALAGSGGR